MLKNILLTISLALALASCAHPRAHAQASECPELQTLVDRSLFFMEKQGWEITMEQHRFDSGAVTLIVDFGDGSAVVYMRNAEGNFCLAGSAYEGQLKDLKKAAADSPLVKVVPIPLGQGG